MLIWVWVALPALASSGEPLSLFANDPWVVRPTTPHGCSSRWLAPGAEAAALAALVLNSSLLSSAQGSAGPPAFDIPAVLHRSHKFPAPLATPLPPDTPPKVARAAVNIESCAALNPDYHTLYYDDAAVIAAISGRFLPTLAAAHPHIHTPMAAAWARLMDDLALSQPFVLKADLFRLAIVWLDGGWWLDADARCLDPITETLASDAVRAELKASRDRTTMASDGASCDADQPAASCAGDDGEGRSATAGCVFAWEGEPPVENRPGKSSPLNWAFGCRRRHPLLLAALERIAAGVAAWRPDRRSEFAARVRLPDNGPWVYVDVLSLTGPALLEHALVAYAGTGNGIDGGTRALRVGIAGEDPADSSTWDRASFVVPATPAAVAVDASPSGRGGGGANDAGSVLVLPFCFFRSKGCPHLAARFGDKVLFHHEFDTDWRPSFWHNFL